MLTISGRGAFVKIESVTKSAYLAVTMATASSVLVRCRYKVPNPTMTRVNPSNTPQYLVRFVCALLLPPRSQGQRMCPLDPPPEEDSAGAVKTDDQECLAHTERHTQRLNQESHRTFVLPRYTECSTLDNDKGWWCRRSECQSAFRRNVLGHNQLSKQKRKWGTFIALDCEMVGIGLRGRRHALARVSIVNVYGHCIYDTFVRPNEEVRDYRTWVSGIRAGDLDSAPGLARVRGDVRNIIRDRVLVGHAIHNDLAVLQIKHPTAMIRDTATWPAYRDLVGSKHPGLKVLFETVFGGLTIQPDGQPHSSIEDARASMALFRNVGVVWL
jgi:DNA polymerase III epsilon subunit-like protein